MIRSLVLATVLLSGCGAKKIQGKLDTCSSELSACQAALKALEGQEKPKPVADVRLEAFRLLAQQFRDAFGADGIDIVLRQGRMVVQLPNAVLFQSGKAQLSPEGEATLTKAAGVLQKHPSRRFLIAGHTDDTAVKAGARFQDNWELSALRATTAVKFLVTKGVDPKQVGAAGFAEFLPAGGNATDEEKAKNRRLEIIVFPTLEEMPQFPSAL